MQGCAAVNCEVASSRPRRRTSRHALPLHHLYLLTYLCTYLLTYLRRDDAHPAPVSPLEMSMEIPLAAWDKQGWVSG